MKPHIVSCRLFTDLACRVWLAKWPGSVAMGWIADTPSEALRYLLIHQPYPPQ